MFERRVRIVLFVLVAAALALLARAAQVQIVQAGVWRALAGDTLRRGAVTETTRGRILDVKGRVLAADVPCNDAAVAYWFIKPEPDEDRLYRDVARKLARRETPDYANLSRDQQHELVLSYMPRARQQLEDMWDTLARAGGVTRAQIDDARREIVQRVEKRRKHIILTRYQQAHDQHAQQDLSAWWRRWLLGEADAPPEVEDFDEPIAEELQGHVVLSNLSSEAYNELRKREDELPGLTLTASQTRHYPAGRAAAHVVGFLIPVKPEHLRNDPEMKDERRAYLQRDLTGGDGLEKLAERSLRGTRGRVEHDLETDQDIVAIEESPGQDLQTTIDIDLQQALRYAFEHVTYEWPVEADGSSKQRVVSPAPGAAVFIDIRTGGILAMGSYPDFDPNTYAKDVTSLVDDSLNKTLTNRATNSSVVPGSTVKPIVGLAAIAEGIFDPHDTIECDGFLYFGGTPLDKLKCWTETMFPNMMNGHQGSHPHPTPGLNPGFDPPAGHLTLTDALQRSCNVFFETLAQRVGEEKLSKWMSNFGLGSATGCGLPESQGKLLRDLSPEQRNDAQAMRWFLWLAGTGQGNIEATPLQMANVAATLGRGGVVIRPTLLADDTERAIAQRKDLKLDPAGLEMVRRGMEAAVQTSGGTGTLVNATLPVPIAGKTGTAQAPPLLIVERDGQGNPILDERGKPRRIPLVHSTRNYTNERAPWYRRVNPVSDGQAPRQSHAWFIGYAPADNPQVAFAVLVEYGGSGGVSAASVVTQMMDALVRLDYIQATRKRLPDAGDGTIRYAVED